MLNIRLRWNCHIGIRQYSKATLFCLFIIFKYFSWSLCYWWSQLFSFKVRDPNLFCWFFTPWRQSFGRVFSQPYVGGELILYTRRLLTTSFHRLSTDALILSTLDDVISSTLEDLISSTFEDLISSTLEDRISSTIVSFGSNGQKKVNDRIEL